MKISLGAGLATLLLVSAGTASATEVLGVGTPSAEQFRQKATSSDAFEIVSSKLALTHSTDKSVKRFARMMIKDHTATTDKLIAIGGISKESLDVKMTPGTDGKYQSNDLLSSSQAADLNSLASKSNDDFNKTYLDDQVQGHKDAVSLMEDYAKNGDNAKLKEFASDTLPTIKEHLTKAQSLDAQLDKK
jgi:putative membrane protein